MKEIDYAKQIATGRELLAKLSPNDPMREQVLSTIQLLQKRQRGEEITLEDKKKMIKALVGSVAFLADTMSSAVATGFPGILPEKIVSGIVDKEVTPEAKATADDIIKRMKENSR